MRHPNVGVFYDSDSVRYHFSQFTHVNPLQDCVSYNNLDEFLRSPCPIKIAGLHVPYPFSNNFKAQVDNISAKCDHVFIISTEVHPEIAAFIQSTDLANITYYICGFVNFELKHAQVKQFMDWFETSTYFYRHWLPEILTRLKPYEPKRRSFDILLGRKKQHRDYVYNCTKLDPYKHIVTYFDTHTTNLGDDQEQWVWEWPGMHIEKKPEWTVDRVNYYGHTMSLSQIIPVNVYNNTAYSAIAETCWQDNFAFFTEKTAKPIMARRLFVVFAGRGYLANLRRLGFKTFGDIIDESYDQETDALVRWRRAWDQVAWLSEQPQELILEQIRPTVEHNAQVMLTTDWYDLFRSQFEQDFARIVVG
jgi:hypothetical protein